MVEIWDDMEDFDDDDFDEEGNIYFESFEIPFIEYQVHCVEIHDYSKLGALHYPFELSEFLDEDIVLN
jgi:hypothetical protein